MTSPLPLPGMVLRASMLSRPYRAWGLILDDSGSGTDFAVLSPTQLTTDPFQVYDDRTYQFDSWHFWRSTSAGQTINLLPEGDSGSGFGAIGSPCRDTNATASGSNSTNRAHVQALWTPGATVDDAQIRVVGSRLIGAATCSMAGIMWTVRDVGPA